MIIAEQIKDIELVGEDISKKAKISHDKLAKLQYLLTKGLYKDPITAVIAEWTNNGIDSVVQAGKSPIENPVIVSINKNDKGQYTFCVEDKGCGLDDRDFEDICMNYLESTKENDNETIGHFGIGMKSFLALERSATFTCRKKGVERKYLVYEGAEFVNFTLVHEKPTKEENGVIAELVINGWQEKGLFVDKAKAKLAYYDTVILIVDGGVIQNDIHRSDLFQWSTLNRNNQIHIALKDVYYTIDYEALGIKPVDLPVAIRLQLGDGLTPTPSRESYITNGKVRDLIMNKIRAISEWFVTKYNDTVKEFATFFDAYDYLGNNNYQVPLKDHGQSFSINPLLNYSKVKILQPKVKGLKLRDGLWYKRKENYLLQEYQACGMIQDNGKMMTKERNINSDWQIFHYKKVSVLVGDDFVGNVKDYLKSKYGKGTLFMRRSHFVRHLGGIVDNKRNVGLSTPDSYYNVLELHSFQKKAWREYIDEWNLVTSSIVRSFVDETKVANTKAYTDWLEKKHADQKVKRALGQVSGKYNGLNKQTGDVTMAYSYERYNKIHFKKEVFPISSLTQRKEVTVILTDEEAEEAKLIIRLNACPNVKFALVGKLERKKIPNHHQFITFKEYMSMSSKPFMRLASSILFRRVVQDYDKLSSHKNGLFKMCVRTMSDDVKKLHDYSQANFTYCGDTKAESIILQAAEENKLFDLQLWDIYQKVREALKKYDFINLLQEPSYYDTEHQKRYNTIINQMLLFRKKYYNDLEGAEIVFTTPKVKV